MNPNYSRTITLYNRIKAKDSAGKADDWYRTVLRGCSWSYDQDKGRYTVRIPETYPGNRPYAAYRRWKDNPGSSFTLSESDLIVLGECSEMVTGRSPDTAAEILIRNKPDAFLIKSFADNTSHPAGKHYKVGG